MLDFNFKIWLEARRLPDSDIPDIGTTWRNFLPKDSNYIVDAEVWDFVNKLGEPQSNALLMYKAQARIDFEPEVRYGPKDISGNLISISSSYLKKAKGEIVSHPQYVIFGFGAVDPVKGSLLIATLPLSYGMDDKVLLAGILRHELRHAVDFVSMKGDMKVVGKPSGEHIAEMDFKGYYKHVMEARAYSEQLSWLLKMMGNNEQLVLNALKESMVYGMDGDQFKCAEYYLKELINNPIKTETAMPMFYGPNVSRVTGQVGDSKQAVKAAKLLAAIMDNFRFKNNVKIKGKL